jgi:hypothetical protein
MHSPEEYRSLAKLCRDRAAIRTCASERREILFDAAEFERRAATLEAERRNPRGLRGLFA